MQVIDKFELPRREIGQVALPLAVEEGVELLVELRPAHVVEQPDAERGAAAPNPHERLLEGGAPRRRHEARRVVLRQQSSPPAVILEVADALVAQLLQIIGSGDGLDELLEVLLLLRHPVLEVAFEVAVVEGGHRDRWSAEG